MPARATRPRPAVPPVAIVVSRYNATITDRLREGAVLEYERRGGRRGDLAIADAPGAFELPALALAAARGGRYLGVVALGCIIKGETSHDRYIAHAVANGLVAVTVATGVPTAFGVLTVDTVGQAEARAGGDLGNKGEEAMSAVLDAIEEIGRLGGSARRRAPREAARRDKPDKAARGER
jgi:6,7-dimethyl-8-ribityllumazine synthase